MFIRTIKNALSPEDCEIFKKTINDTTETTDFSTTAMFKNDKFKDIKLAEKLFKTIPEGLIDPACRPNDIIMTGMYKTGDAFGLHVDTGIYYNSSSREKCIYTYLIYLNDDFKGGETAFYTDSFEFKTATTPEKGMGLLFDLTIWHKGNEILSGEKYWISIEVIGKF